MTDLDQYLQLFDYHLPQSQIAQVPATPRDSSKLLVMDRHSGQIQHHVFKDLAQILTLNDVLVLNQTKVFPARLSGKKSTGGKAEILLTQETGVGEWQALSFGGLKAGQTIILSSGLSAQVINKDSNTGLVDLRFDKTGLKLQQALDHNGLVPIPPYIDHTPLEQTQLKRRYQTTYAKDIGSSAAPTAGLHFTHQLLSRLQDGGVAIEYLTLHVGPGTFMPVRPKHLKHQQLHQEYFSINNSTAARLIAAKKSGKRIVSVGTTTTRALESAYNKGELNTGDRSTRLFIKPPYKFKFIDALITNFHLPRSSLLMLVSAFVSSPNTQHQFLNFKSSPIGLAYQTATKNNYRFYSFGDAMFII